MLKEQYRPVLEDVHGYGGKYKIDIYGNIYQQYKTKLVKRKPSVKPRGHLEIRLKDDTGKRHTHNVARLVALHFIPKPYLADSVIHLNGNKQDAYIENLKWVTKRQIGLKFGHKVRQAKRVCKISSDGEIVDVYHSARAAAKSNYMSYQTILDRCNGKVKGRFAPDGYEYAFEKE